MNVRKASFSAEEGIVFYVALRKGPGGKGYNADQLRKIDPIICEMEKQGMNDDDKGISCPIGSSFIIIMKEKEYSLAFDVLKNSTGWSGGRQGRTFLNVIEKMENIPVEQMEEEKK